MLPSLLALLFLAQAQAMAPAEPAQSPQIDGFHRVWVEPEPFVASLVPSEPPAPPAPEALPGVLVLSLDAEAVAAIGLTPQTLAERVSQLDGVIAAQLSEAGDALWLRVQGEDPARLGVPPLDGPPVALSALGAVHLMPQMGPRMPVPQAGPGPHDLVVRNELGIRAEVRIGDQGVGELDPHAEGILRGVAPGIYSITLVAPDGARHALQVATRARVLPGNKPPRPEQIR